MPELDAGILLALPSIRNCPKDLAQGHCSGDPKTQQTGGRSQELPAHFFAVRPLQGVGKTSSGSTYPVVDPQLPNEQAGFRQGRSTVLQILKLTSDIEESFELGHKGGVVLEDLSAAYDTVWQQGLALKLLCVIDRHLVRLIIIILSNRSFKLKTSSGQTSRLRLLKTEYHKDRLCHHSSLTHTSAKIFPYDFII